MAHGFTTVLGRDPDERSITEAAARSKAQYDAAYDLLMAAVDRAYFMLPDEGREPDPRWASCEALRSRVSEALMEIFTAETWAAWRSL